jgi:metal-sulfur cluster biosynthetic enzyme
MNEASERIESDPQEPEAASTVSSGEPRADEGRSSDTNAPNGKAALAKEDVLEALKNVLDPELGINIVDLGLVYDVEISDGHVHVTYTLTTMGCPIGPLVEAQMHQLIDPLPGIDSFEAEMVLRPPWSPEMMSEEAKEALGFF